MSADPFHIIKLSSPATREFWEIPILHEDEHLLAMDKPARLLSSPDRYDPERPNLMKLLHKDIERNATWTVRHGIRYLSNPHRLDFETTGIFLLAKSKECLTALSNLFGSEKPRKTYLALVQGVPGNEEFTINAPLGPHPAKPEIIRVTPKGKKAITRFRIKEWFDGYALLEAQPVTGRTHQIRVHLQHARLPLVGDATYGGQPLYLSRLKRNYRPKRNRVENPLIGRVALHAFSLEFDHPMIGASLHIKAPVPNDFEVAWKFLRKFSQRRAS